MTADPSATRSRRRGPQPLILAVIVVIILGLASWLVIRLVTGAESTSDPSTAVCLPAPLAVSEANPSAGETIELTAGGVDCGLTFPGTAHYDVGVTDASGAEIPIAHAVQVRTDGGFATELTIPADASPGAATIVVKGSAYDACDDSTATCLGYTIDITIAEN